MFSTPVDFVLAAAASFGAVLAAQIAAAHLRHALLNDYKAALRQIVETLLARDELAHFVPLFPPGPKWWPVLVVMLWLTSGHAFTVVVVRHDGREVQSVLLGWHRSQKAFEALRALLPELGLGGMKVSGGSTDDYLSFSVSGESDHWFIFVVPSGRRAFRAAMRDAGLKA